MKYRDHTGGLKESMETKREVNSLSELKAHLQSKYDEKVFGKILEIKFEYSSFDSRTGWDTWYVMIKTESQKGFIVAGMSDNNVFE